jgi:2-polyprenyl-3-methyl-5-hydroxy-6-metoxy-1,4-benzoquinol methylase
MNKTKNLSLAEARRQHVTAIITDFLQMYQKPYRHLLDVGCGKGEFLRHIIDQRIFQRVTGLDIDLDVIMACQQSV